MSHFKKSSSFGVKSSKNRFLSAAAFLLFLLLGVVLLNFAAGTMPISPGEVWNTFSGKGLPQHELILFSIRLPRIVAVMLVGDALSASGATLQSVTENDLAEPGILGISSGSAMFAVVYIQLTGSIGSSAMWTRQCI